jgi:ribosomal protein L16 Arg81 hydroxylase
MDNNRIANELVKIAKALVAGKLTIVSQEVDHKNTEALRAMKKLRARSNGSLPESIEVAGRSAQKHNKEYYVYLGNAFGAGVWRISYKNEAFDSINNQSEKPIYMVAPDLEITKITIKR